MARKKMAPLKITEPPKNGRPSDYSVELVDEFCLRIATSIRGVTRICEEDDDMPAEGSIYRWLIRFPDFREKYARAKDYQCDARFEGLSDIAADGRNDWMERLAFNGGAPGWELNGESVNRSKLRIDVEKWALSKLMPKKYADNQKIDLTAVVDTNVKQQAVLLAELPPELLLQVLEALEAKKEG